MYSTERKEYQIYLPISTKVAGGNESGPELWLSFCSNGCISFGRKETVQNVSGMVDTNQEWCRQLPKMIELICQNMQRFYESCRGRVRLVSSWIGVPGGQVR